MLFNIIKVTVSALIIALITEVAKKYPDIGGVLAALPLVSFLSLIWLSVQGSTVPQLTQFTKGVLMGLPATVMFIIGIYISLKLFHSLPISFLVGLGFWGSCLFIQKSILHLL